MSLTWHAGQWFTYLRTSPRFDQADLTEATCVVWLADTPCHIQGCPAGGSILALDVLAGVPGPNCW